MMLPSAVAIMDLLRSCFRRRQTRSTARTQPPRATVTALPHQWHHRLPMFVMGSPTAQNTSKLSLPTLETSESYHAPTSANGSEGVKGAVRELSPSILKGALLSPYLWPTPRISSVWTSRMTPSFRDAPSMATGSNPQDHSVFQAPWPAAIPARLGPRGYPDGARPGHPSRDGLR